MVNIDVLGCRILVIVKCITNLQASVCRILRTVLFTTDPEVSVYRTFEDSAICGKSEQFFAWNILRILHLVNFKSFIIPKSEDCTIIANLNVSVYQILNILYFVVNWNLTA
jgi:hypothetical protein